MKTLVVIRTFHHKNTLKIAKVIAKVLNADIRDVRGLKYDALEDYDVIGFGSGIYFFKFHKDITEFIKNIPSGKGKKVFVFSTSGFGFPSFNKSTVELLSKKGFKVLGSFISKGLDTWGLFWLMGGIAKGHPNDEDLNRAKIFAMEVSKHI